MPDSLLVESKVVLGKTVRRLLWRRRFYDAVDVLLRSVSAAAAVILLAATIDSIFTVSYMWRRGIVIVSLAFAVITGALCAWKRCRAHVLGTLEMVERGLGTPQAHSVLVNAWQFIMACDEREGIEQELMCREIGRAARMREELLRSSAVVFGVKRFLAAFASWRKAVLLAAMLCCILAGVSAGMRQRILRVVAPGSLLAGFESKLRLYPVVGEHRIAAGSAIVIRVTLPGAQAPAGQIPYLLTQTDTVVMSRQADTDQDVTYFYAVAGLREELVVRLRWGDYQSRAWKFIPVEEPQVVALKCSLRHPGYTRRAPVEFKDPSSVSVLAASLLVLEARFDRPVSVAKVYVETDAGAALAASMRPGASERWVVSLKADRLVKLAGARVLRLRFAIADEDGQANEHAWVLPVNVQEDTPPVVDIIEPVFTSIRIDPDEEVMVSWRASDDFALKSIEQVTEVSTHRSLRVVWSPAADDKGSVEAAGALRFSPRVAGLKVGDKAVLYLLAQDYDPAGKAAVASAQSLTVMVEDFRGAHERNLEESSGKIREMLLQHLDSALAVDRQVTEAQDASLPALAALSAGSQEASRRLAQYARELETDPLASQEWAWGVKEMATQ
ncbi:MAG: hypothetical protein AABZ44_07795, partial [Elusimicrobiota bacterium]